MTNQPNIDQAKSDAFAEHMLGILNHAALSLMMVSVKKLVCLIP
jgi:hypothetical protein